MQDSTTLPPVYDNHDLPAYSLSGPGRAIPPSNLTELSNGSTSKEFSYDISLKAKNSHASLMLYGDSKLSKQLPTFTEGSKIHGKVKVDLTSGESINAVVVTIRGQLISGSTFDTFLDYSQTLWPESTGQKTTRKLQGEHEFPFSINIPKEVALTVGPKDAPRLEVFKLPQTFLERHAKASIQYEVIVRLTRGLLKLDNRIITPIGYIPIIRPGPPSRLRQLAYEETTPIPGPVADPEGWFSLPPCPVVGKLYNRQFVDATCTLSIALPLSYTRGSVIPLHLVIQSHDVRTLDVLSSPLAAVCRLRRTFRFHPEEHRTVDPKLRKDEIEHSELATWWPSDELPRPEKETFKRMLDGELLLPPDLKPTTILNRFRIEYSIVLFPFDTNNFQTTSSEALFNEPVEIATDFCEVGPRPRTYVPEHQAVASSSSNSSSLQSPIRVSGFF